MPTIYIRDPETTLAVDASFFTLRSKGRRIGRIPPTMIEQVIIDHGVEVTRAALDRLGTTGVPVTFLGREGSVQARLVPPWKPEPGARLAQAAAHLDPALRLGLARRWVDAKLANCCTVLRRYLSNHSDEQLSSLTREIQRWRDQVAGVDNLPGLMGLEGNTARAWFEGLGRMLRPPWLTFTSRNRRPPRDPGNAVLSYSYAVISHQLLACTESVGLDPYIGYLHYPNKRRPALVMDLMEPFRPALGDRLMLRLLNLGTLKADDFHEPEGPANGVRISPDGRASVLKVLAEWMNLSDDYLGEKWPSPGGILLDEVERFAQHARHGILADFVPYHLDPREIREMPRP